MVITTSKNKPVPRLVTAMNALTDVKQSITTYGRRVHLPKRCQSHRSRLANSLEPVMSYQVQIAADELAGR